MQVGAVFVVVAAACTFGLQLLQSDRRFCPLQQCLKQRRIIDAHQYAPICVCQPDPKMRKSSGKIVGVPFLGIGDHTVKVKEDASDRHKKLLFTLRGSCVHAPECRRSEQRSGRQGRCFP